LTKSAPMDFSLSTAARADPRSVTRIDPGHFGFGPSSLGPDVTIRGPSGAHSRSLYATGDDAARSRFEAIRLAKLVKATRTSYCEHKLGIASVTEASSKLTTGVGATAGDSDAA
jgi:hypothetical protein